MSNNRGQEVVTRRAKAAVRGLFVSFLIILIAVLLLEIVLRTTHILGARPSWVEPDTRLGWRFTPNRSYWSLKENDLPIEGKINSLGWRDRERQPTKPPGTYRVAVLGDSYVAAYHVELDSTFLAIAERSLTGSLGREIELLNFGRQGATQAEEYLILQSDALPTEPDMVALLFIPQNDVNDVSKATADGLLRPFYHLSEDGELVLDTSFANSREFKWKKRINPLKQRSALVSLLAEWYTAYRKSQRQARLSGRENAGHAKDGAGAEGDKAGPEVKDSGARIGGYLSLCTSSPNDRYLRNYALNKILIRAIADLCRRRGVEFLLICGDLATEPGDERRYKALDSSFDPGFFDKDLEQFADSLRIEYLGLQDPFERSIRGTGSPHHWVHWNYAGHRVAADALTKKMADLLAD